MIALSRLASTIAPVLASIALLAGCGGAPSPVAEPQAYAAARPEMVAPTAPALQRSYFTKDVTGALTEQDLQTVLEAPIDLQLPARIGVIPLAEPFDPKGSPSLGLRNTASHHFAKALAGNPHFSQVTDISTDLPNVGGIEGLRVIAARYRLRYLVLYSERFEDSTHLNGWAWLYPTVLGMFFAPGVTVESQGIAQADFLDVRTGTILFSVTEPLRVSKKEQMIGAARSHKEEQGKIAADGARSLAKRVHVQTNALVAFAEATHGAQPKPKLLPSPVVAFSPGTSVPAEMDLAKR
ncbi:hypothetical protein [Polyangium jinanense]|uniref:Lipoprotein n=1 Tax=Polyangium jinanense TaxID=2829994 RepID=A0A9X4AR32_9BACT|nr:hypothetical protein [Polyangium jinanense]MDC3953194.1 hypothetical protein [Polyangium jinanense]MDC3979685.1 hypothetical protein [Polyangium jinanense]